MNYESISLRVGAIMKWRTPFLLPQVLHSTNITVLFTFAFIIQILIYKYYAALPH